jgi:hypothetical protein
MSSRRIDRRRYRSWTGPFCFAVLVAVACESSNEGLDGDWVWEVDDGDDIQVQKIVIETNDAGEVDKCSYSARDEDRDFDITKLSGSCEVEKESDGSVRIAVKLKKAQRDDLYEGAGGSGEGDAEGFYDILPDMGDSEKKFVFDCQVAVDEEQLECQLNGGEYYEFEKD